MSIITRKTPDCESSPASNWLLSRCVSSVDAGQKGLTQVANHLPKPSKNRHHQNKTHPPAPPNVHDPETRQTILVSSLRSSSPINGGNDRHEVLSCGSGLHWKLSKRIMNMCDNLFTLFDPSAPPLKNRVNRLQNGSTSATLDSTGPQTRPGAAGRAEVAAPDLGGTGRCSLRWLAQKEEA